MFRQVFTKSLTDNSRIAEDLCNVRLEQYDICPLHRAFEILASDATRKIGFRDISFVELVRLLVHIVAAHVESPHGQL